MGIGLQFMHGTRYQNLPPSGQMRGMPPPPLEAPLDPGTPTLPLPPARDEAVASMPVGAAIARRRSVRDFAPTPVSLAQVSFLLWATQGVVRTFPQATIRTVPSAGARHALETFLVVNRVDGLKPGLYRYLATSHALASLHSTPDVGQRLVHACLGQSFVGSAALTFVWVAVERRMTWRYGERGYRYLLLDAGHVCQNLYLAATALGLGCCAIGAFDDEAVDRLVGVDGREMFTVYLGTVGVPSPKRSVDYA